MLEIKLLLLILIANGAPIMSHAIFQGRFNFPVDFKVVLADSNPLFGKSKTYRGVIASLIITPLLAPILGFAWHTGLLFAVFAMIGDLFSSFIKRRMGKEPSSMAFGLDQIPEALFPLLVIAPIVNISIQQIIVLVLIFIVVELLLSRLLFKLKLKNKPY